MLTVHHLEKSRSHRILWLLEELGMDYEVITYKRDPKTMRADPALERIHPLGRSPLVSLDDGEVLFESGAIIASITELYGESLRPERGTAAYRRYRAFMHYAEGSLMPPLLIEFILGQFSGKQVPRVFRPAGALLAKGIGAAYSTGEVKRHLRYLEGELGAHDYIVGDEFTAADIQLFYPLEGAGSRGDLVNYPNVARYLERLHARPAYRRALERGGPVML